MNKIVLVVDDELWAVEKLVGILERLGYTTLYESDCVPAMHRYREGGIDAVVADGSAGGDILAETIRERDKSTPIALYTYDPSRYTRLEQIEVSVFNKGEGPQPVVDYIHVALQKK